MHIFREIKAHAHCVTREIKEDINGNLLIYLPKRLEYFEEKLIKIMKQSMPWLFIFVILLWNSKTFVVTIVKQ